MDLNQVLIEAAKDGNMLVLKTALEKEADINAKDGSGMTALMCAEQKGYAEIVDFLKEKGAKEEETDFAIVYYNSGKTYGALGEYQKAIEEYTKAVELNPQYVDRAYYNRGWAYFNLEEYQKAIEEYTKVVELIPYYTDAYHGRGRAYGALEEYQKAIEDYTKVMELDPEYAGAYHARGLAYGVLGEYQKAIYDCYQAGFLYLKQNNKTQAPKCIDLMKTIDPSSPLIDKLQDLIDQI